MKKHNLPEIYQEFVKKEIEKYSDLLIYEGFSRKMHLLDHALKKIIPLLKGEKKNI